MKDGHLNKCIECVKRRVRKHRSENIEEIRAYDRKRGRTEKRLTLLRINSKRFRERYQKFKDAYIKKNPQKHLAHNKLHAAIKSKKIIKQPCEVCGDIKSQGHHDDYTKPLEVRWLCQKHHKELHRKYKD